MESGSSDKHADNPAYGQTIKNCEILKHKCLANYMHGELKVQCERKFTPTPYTFLCKPSAHYACTASLIDGLGVYAFTHVERYRLATLQDRMPMRESTHDLRGDFLCLRKVQRASGSVEVSWCDYAHRLFRLFSQHISRTHFRKSTLLFFTFALFWRHWHCSWAAS